MENLERNCFYRVMFPFHWYLGIRTRQVMPGVGDLCFVFLTRGPEFWTEKLSRGWGFWWKKLVARRSAGGDGNRSNWYLHYRRTWHVMRHHQFRQTEIRLNVSYFTMSMWWWTGRAAFTKYAWNAVVSCWLTVRTTSAKTRPNLKILLII